jgi:DNA-binding transcriptional regulator GbsR (MarR family)
MFKLTPIMQDFIVHWGRMGTRWGISRTVAQIYALLYISPKPLNAEEISGVLSVARSTVSTGLHELQGWGIVRVVNVLGDRRDHFEAMGDVWEMFRVVVDERKRRELDPTLMMLREAVTELENRGGGEPHTREKLLEMLDFFETAAGLYEQVEKLPTNVLVRAAKMGDSIQKLLGLVGSGS